MSKTNNNVPKDFKQMTIGQRLKFLREKKGNSRDELTSILGYSEVECYARLEKDHRLPTVEKLEILSQYHELPIDLIYYGEDRFSKLTVEELLIIADFQKLSDRDKRILLKLLAAFNSLDT